MPRRILIAGSASLLASHLAARQLTSSEDELFLLLRRPQGVSLTGEEVRTLVRHAVEGRDGTADERGARWEPLHPRVRVLQELEPEYFDASPGSARLDEAWYLDGGFRSAADDELLRHLLVMLPRWGAREFNHVGLDRPYQAGRMPLRSVASGGIGLEGLAMPLAGEAEVEATCGAAGVACRLFRTSLLISEDPPRRGLEREGFHLFLAALHDLKSELEERVPGYIGARPLRCWAPVGAALGLVRVEQVAERLVRVARSPDARSGRFDLTAPERIPFAKLCERVGPVLGLNLIPVSDAQSLTAVDQQLQERLGAFLDWLAASDNPGAKDAWGVPGPSPEELHISPEAQVALFQTLRQGMDAALTERRARAAALFTSLAPRVMDRDGTPLSYFAAGSEGTPLVILNALGQGLFYWSRLVDGLRQNHRVLIWEPRGLESGPQPFLLKDHVDDLEAILRNEGIEACHLVGWCTGPKVAVEFYRRQPGAVLSMVFLNGSLRWSGSPKELETAYERNFDPLCRMLVRRPAMASSVLKSLRLSMSRQEEAEWAGLSDSEAAVRVLTLMNRDLRPHTQHPFRSESTIVNYAHQIIDFWAYDIRTHVTQVRAPVLLLSGERDSVSAPDTSRHLAELIPDCRHIHVTGATHYCLYDRPEFVAEQLETFFRELPKTSTTLSQTPAVAGRR